MNYYVYINGEVVGPFALKEITVGIESGIYPIDVSVCEVGEKIWRSCADVCRPANPAPFVSPSIPVQPSLLIANKPKFDSSRYLVFFVIIAVMTVGLILSFHYVVIAVIAFGLVLSFHYVLPTGEMFPKESLAFRRTLITQRDIDELVNRYNNASQSDRDILRNDSYIKKLMDRGLISNKKE